MSLKAPNLDDRKFQDIVREARSKIPLYCPDWTDYNLSDPGITLIELFAWMVDMLLYRLNRVPEKNYIKFMDLIGIHLEPPKAAVVDVTFQLSASQPRALTIPRGTEVATVRTETQEAITFTTQRDLIILVPTQLYALTSPDDQAFTDCMPALKNLNQAVKVFQPVPQENNAFYLGYKEELQGHLIQLTIDSSIEGIGVDPRDPPLVWEYWDSEREKWSSIRVDKDSTGGLNTPGEVLLHIPYSSIMKEIDGKSATWIRCRALNTRPGQRPYTSSPIIRSVETGSLGGTVPANHALKINNEVLGRSDGTPGQKFTLRNIPVLMREPGETIEVEKEIEGEFEPWQEIGDFSKSGENDRHFTCDGTSGEIQFGPSIRDPSGQERQYGKIPPSGRLIRFNNYQSGGGATGNVGELTIKVLKSSISYVAKVVNFEAARGGTDAETLEHAKLRVPEILKVRTRAVTADDFEYFARTASPRIARAKCLFPGSDNERQMPPGMVRVLLVPAVPECKRLLDPAELEVPKRVADEVFNYLDERRLLATRLEISVPEYIPVSVEIRIKSRPGSNRKQVIIDVEKELYRYINPICGGPDGSGWPFGRNLSISEIYSFIQKVDNVDFIEEVALLPIDSKTGVRQQASTKVNVPPGSLIRSSEHEVTVE
jgi:predicted phage baseplate assembly protein